MGNIYYEQKKFPQAIKMYRMALDQIPSTGKELRFRIFRNIGNAFVQLGQFQDAVDSYDSIMVGSADIQTAFNLLLCLYVRGDKEKMKRHFLKMLSIPIMGMTDDDEEKVDEGGDASNERRDLLKEELYLRHEQVRTSKCTAIPFDMPHAAWLMLYASSPPPSVFIRDFPLSSSCSSCLYYPIKCYFLLALFFHDRFYCRTSHCGIFHITIDMKTNVNFY